MILRKLPPPEERFSEVLLKWAGETVVILGGGPSLSLDQVRLVEVAHKEERVKCIVVNDSYLLAPWADVHYAADAHWHRWHSEGVDGDGRVVKLAKPMLGLDNKAVMAAWARFAGQKCTIENSGGTVKDPAVHVLRNYHGTGNHGPGVSLESQFLVTGRCSGFQAINLSLLAGAAHALLLGFDANEAAPISHWHGGHPRPMPVQVHEQWRRHFTSSQRAIAEAGMRVINCSPGTAITAFDRMPLDKALSLVCREPA